MQGLARRIVLLRALVQSRNRLEMKLVIPLVDLESTATTLTLASLGDDLGGLLLSLEKSLDTLGVCGL